MPSIRQSSSARKSTNLSSTRKTATKAAVKTIAVTKLSTKQSPPNASASAKANTTVKKGSAQTKATKSDTTMGEANTPKLLKEKKIKLVRDSFTIPKPEYMVLDVLKTRALVLGLAVKKSELLRAGIKALASMSDSQFTTILKSIPTLKSGRPSK